MTKIIELTQDDNKRIGLDPSAVVVIIGLTKPDQDHPKAKTMIRWQSAALGGAVHSFLRDDLRQVRNLVPVAGDGRGWVELSDQQGNTVLVPDLSATGYQELDDGGFLVTFNVPTGPVQFAVTADIHEIRQLAGLQPEPKAAEPETRTRPSSRRKKR